MFSLYEIIDKSILICVILNIKMITNTFDTQTVVS